MERLTDIKGIIFDYGGTLDTNSRHWSEVLWSKYEEYHVPVGKADFREAYVYGERTLARIPLVKPEDNFHDVLCIKTKLQMEYLIEQGKLEQTDAMEYAVKIADSCYQYVLNVLEKTRPVVQSLSRKYKLVLVSNFYGNIRSVLKDFELDDFFSDVIESSVVGVCKPDPAIYRLGVEVLKLSAENVLVVGDSFRKIWFLLRPLAVKLLG